MKLLAIFLLPTVLPAAIWPETLGSYRRVSADPSGVPADSLWQELGFQEAETAAYAAPPRKFGVRAFRFQDSTGAMAAFQSERPPESKPSKLGSLAVETATSLVLAHGNYLLSFDGYKPSLPELAPLLQRLPRLEQSSLPNLVEKLPAAGLTPNSSRYIIGPVGLAQFEPRIPPATAAFHLGTEAQAGIYKTPAGDMRVSIFSYPTPQIARERVPEFEKLAGAVVKRAGPLVAVTIAPPDPNAAERTLSQIRYEATVTWSEYVPTARDNPGNLVVAAFLLTGVLLLFALFSGLLFGGMRALWRHMRHGEEPEAMIVLHLSDRR
jgi:hypothetical protein